MPTKPKRQTDAPGIATEEQASVHQLDVGRLADAPEWLENHLTRIGFRIDEGRKEFLQRIDVDEARRRRDELEKHTAKSGSDEARRDADKANRQWRFEFAFSLWQEAIEHAAAGRVTEALARADAALAWTAYWETEAARSARKRAVEAGRSATRPLKPEQQCIVAELRALEMEKGSANDARVALIGRIASRHGISREAARKRLDRAIKAAAR